jgi:hypothetical protein
MKLHAFKNNRAITLAQARIEREETRTAFRARLERVKADLSARSIGSRVAERIGEEAVEVLDYTFDVARDSKGIIAGTLAALVLWLFRNPIIGWAEGLFGSDGKQKECEDDDRSED